MSAVDQSRPGHARRPLLDSPLRGRRIAVPESRQLDVLSALFERRQARVIRVPLVSIRDTPDQDAVLDWLRRFIATPPDLFIILTGEGLRRLRAAAARNGLEAGFIAALAASSKLCRGPKPGRALGEVGLSADLLAAAPTSEGVIATLKTQALTGRTVAVQLYGQDPNRLLMSFLAEQELGGCSSVAPYIYSDDSDEEAVVALIESMAGAGIDLIAFTSKAQVQRLWRVAEKRKLQSRLAAAFATVVVAAVGPVVADELSQHGVTVQVMPDGAFFMKPLVRAAERAFSEA